MDRNYLLTYIRDGYGCFEWFETEEEMNVFIESVCKLKDYKVLEKTHVRDAVAL
jgi:hypothetical protein